MGRAQGSLELAKAPRRAAKATPRSGHAPISALAVLHDLTKERVSERLGEQFRYLLAHEHGELASVVDGVTFVENDSYWPEGNAIVAKGRFVKRGSQEDVGDFECHLDARGDDKEHPKLTLYQDSFYLADQVKDRGWGTTWWRKCEARYRDGGIKSIRLLAGGEAGGYFWAKEGFVPSDEDFWEFWNSLEDRLGELVSKGTISEATHRRWNRDADEGRLSSVAQVVRLGYRSSWRDDQGRRCWPGKMLLLDTEWEAIKILA